ncbi:LamG domain-containing protein [Akkermansiaceae bacterium]|nr:LamG domain-containing protein [Akkermansiaceae bacterium]
MLIFAGVLRADLLHRWSFNEFAGSPTAGTVYLDSVGGVAMTLKGVGVVHTGARIELPGSTLNGEPEATISAYLDLPNGIISSKSDLKVEMWAVPLGARDWAPLFDFGRWNTAGDGLGAPGEWTGNSGANPGASVAGDALAILLSRGLNINQQRNAVTLNGTRLELDTNLATNLGQTYHYLVTMTDGAGSFGASGMQMEVYRDGLSTGTLDLPHRLDVIEDVNCWLGRLQWNSLSTANVAYDEVRIYDHALSPTEVGESLAAGPDVVFAPLVLQPDSATLHHQQKVRLDVLANDGAGASPGSVTVVTPPSNGTAVPDAQGRILYAHAHHGDAFDG